jgi:hypothetical protein
MARLWMIDGLVTQMADRAILVSGPIMMVRDAAQNHHEHQQREKRYRNSETFNWSVLRHGYKG